MYRFLLSCIAFAIAAAWTVAAAAADPFGYDEYFVGATVTAAELEAAGFTLDDYYEPDIYYSRPESVEFSWGIEDGRLDVGILDGRISQVVLEFNILLPSEDGESLAVRSNIEDLALEIAEQLDDSYSEYQTESWMVEDGVLPISVFDFFDAEHYVSMRISQLAITLIYGSADQRQSREEWVASMTPADEEAVVDE
jgi:hypothetical protein